jgi:hypothetical protein
MKPPISETRFGSITVGGETLEHDILIRLDGRVRKRKRKLSKAVYGTSHVISLEEAKHVYQKGAGLLIVGTGQEGCVELSKEAAAYFKKKGCAVELAKTPEAAERWNGAAGAVIGLFHVTC